MTASINDKLKKYKSLFSTTLSTGIGTGTSDTLTPATVTGLPTDTAITLTIDRIDASGTATPSKMERIKGIVSSGNIINYVRAVDGTTEQAHTAGAVVEMVWNADDWNNAVDHLLVQHGQDGVHTSALVTSLKATGAEINTGTEDAKIVTPKAIQDSYLSNGYNSLSRQAIINGNFSVWQRGTSFGTPNATYSADRWKSYNNPASQATTITRQDGTGVYGSTYCLRYQRTAGQTGTNVEYLTTSLESINSQKFRGKKVTLSFYARCGANYSPTNSILTAQIMSGTGWDEDVLVSFTGAAAIANENKTLTTSWQLFTVTTTNVVGSINQLALRFLNTPTGTAGAADYFEITQVQLCAGDVALPFMPKSYEEELRACQRYYWRNTAGSTYQAFAVGYCPDTTHLTCCIHLPTKLRALPGAIETGGNLCVDRSGGVNTVTALSIVQNGTNSLDVSATVASGLTAGQAALLAANNDTTAYIAFNSEL